MKGTGIRDQESVSYPTRLASRARTWAVALAALLGAGSALAASGDSEKTAVTVKVGGSASVQLVEEEIIAGTNTSKVGVYYLKTTLRRGTAYTVWIEGGDAAKIGYWGISAYPYETDWSGDDWAATGTATGMT